MSKSKAKINFEIDEQHLANAKAFAALNHVSLNKLVASYFASLGQDEALAQRPINPLTKVLLDVHLGRISIVEASHELNLPDGGYVLHLMREAKLSLPRLPEDFVRKQAEDGFEALKACLVETKANPAKRSRVKSLATQ